MISRKRQYNPSTKYLNRIRKPKLVKRIRKNMAKLGLKPEGTLLSTT
jgi:hypothetical protein